MFLKDFMKSWIAMSCEGIWLYYGLTLLAKLQWSITSSPHLFIWLLTSILGYGISTFFRGKDLSSRYVYCIYVAGAMIVLSLQNYSIVEPSWKYRLAAGLALLFLYFRGIYFAVQHPKRHHMLLRLEGNMLFYLFYVLVQLGNPFTTGAIHVTFAVSLVLSLIGMVLTLGDSAEGDAFVSQKVGDARWVLYPSFAFVVGGLILSALLLLPSMHQFISSVLEGLGGGVISFGERFLAAVKWLLHLIPPPDSKGKLDMPAPPTTHLPRQNAPESGAEFPVMLLIGVLALLVLSVFYYLTRLLRKSPPKKNEKTPVYSSPSSSFFTQLMHWILTVFQSLRIMIRRVNPRVYSLRIYWNYYQFLRWGSKKGIPRRKSETPREFAVRVGEQLKGDSKLQRQVCEFSEQFAAVYYSDQNIPVEGDFDVLIHELKRSPIPKKGK